ncbi:MAG: DUF1049 domain-containing protein [Alphaproteobacteria bacterium]|nr:DUF1049 domain-containing protein [Alphaproteobacteria bacterium]
MRPLGALAFAILAALAAWLAVANRAPVTVSFDALRPGSPASSFDLPLFAVLLAGVLAGLLIGGAYMWARTLGVHRALKDERQRAARLQKLLADETLARGEAAPATRQLSRTSD